MKYCKRFTEGLAYLACFFILAFLAHSYFTFKLPEDAEMSKLDSVFESIQGFKEYLILLGIMAVTAAVTSATDRAPYVGILVSGGPVYYVFKLYYDKNMVFMPMIIMILTLFFFTGEIIATVQWAKRKLHPELVPEELEELPDDREQDGDEMTGNLGGDTATEAPSAAESEN